MENEKNNMVAPIEPKLDAQDLQVIFHVCLRLLGGCVRIPQQLLDDVKKLPNDLYLDASCDTVNKCWYIKTKIPERKRIIKPDKRLIVPN